MRTSRAKLEKMSNTQVVVFHMDGCPACREYLPRFRRVAVKYRPFVAIKAANVSRTSNHAVANKYKIDSVPTTLILNAQDAVLKRYTGALDAKSIEQIFAVALREP